MSSAAASGLLRPMPFGRLAPRDVADPVLEPLWEGRRVVVGVTLGTARLADEDGEPVEGFDGLRAEIVRATSADRVLLDGYLVPRFRDTTGLAALIGDGTVTSPASIGRQLFLGSRSADREDRRDALAASLARRSVEPREDESAFVAIDLLELEGEALLDVPLLERKRLLDSVVADTETVRRTTIVRPPIEAWFGQWRALGFAAYAVKATNGRYTPGEPSRDWAIGAIPRR